MKISRRQVGKGLAGSLAISLAGGNAGALTPVSVEEPPAPISWLPVLPGIWKATIGTPEALTPVRSRYVPPRQDALKEMTAVAQPPVPAPELSVSSRGVLVQLPLAPQEQIYGFGLQFFSLQHRAKKVVTRVNADPRMDTGDTHAPVPFYVTSRGYGVFIDTARYVTFYCGQARPKPQEAHPVISGGTAPLYTKTLDDDQSSSLLAEVPNSPGVDIYLFAGPSLLEAVRRFNLFAGGGVAPPEWGLGFWYRADSNAKDSAVIALAREFRERNIPCDVFGLEPGWQSHAYSCTFTWHEGRFPNPKQFLSEMKTKQYRVNLWEHAYTNPGSPLFAPLLEHSGDKGVWGGLVPDFAGEEARAAFGKYHGEALIDIGVDGFKLDECDNSDYTGGWSFPELSRFPSGADGEQMHSLFGLGYQRALWNPFLQRKKPTYNLVRSSGALAAPFPFVLYSDLYDHRQFVRALVNSGFSGLLWCPEVRDAKSEEDLIRRMQVVMFSPLAMVNGWYIPSPPWKQLDRKRNNAGEIKPGWEQLEARCREIIGWRMQMVPYLKSAFARYAQDGTPPFRALAMEWPDHAELAKVDDAWMVGDSMLVAPLFAGEPGRTVHLPPGEWHDFWTGRRISGSAPLQVPASESRIPVYVRSGSVIPLASVANTTAEAASRRLDVRVFGDGRRSFVWDTPEYGRMTISWNAASQKGSIDQKGTTEYTVQTWTVHG